MKFLRSREYSRARSRTRSCDSYPYLTRINTATAFKTTVASGVALKTNPIKA